MVLKIMFFVGLLLLVVVVLMLFFAPFLIGAPYQPSSWKRARRMIRFASIKKGDKVVDLGSGNGRLVIEMARKGAEAHGYEINPLLVWISRRNIRKEGLKGKAFIHWGNFWGVNLSRYDVVSLFQIGYVMPFLSRKLKRELKKGSRIVSNTWRFKDWRPIKVEDGVYLYKA